MSLDHSPGRSYEHAVQGPPGGPGHLWAAAEAQEKLGVALTPREIPESRPQLRDLDGLVQKRGDDTLDGRAQENAAQCTAGGERQGRDGTWDRETVAAAARVKPRRKLTPEAWVGELPLVALGHQAAHLGTGVLAGQRRQPGPAGAGVLFELGDQGRWDRTLEAVP